MLWLSSLTDFEVCLCASVNRGANPDLAPDHWKSKTLKEDWSDTAELFPVIVVTDIEQVNPRRQSSDLGRTLTTQIQTRSASYSTIVSDDRHFRAGSPTGRFSTTGWVAVSGNLSDTTTVD